MKRRESSHGNAFEEGRRKVIPAVLIYARCGGHVLMLHRDGRKKKDIHKGKWNGLGGKCEADESPLEAAQREFREESGLELPLEAFKPLGTLQFPNFKPLKKEDWLVFLFVARVPAELFVRVRSGDEGNLKWVPEHGLLDLNLWEGDRQFLPYVLAEQPVVGTFWYESGRVIRHWLQGLVKS